jgi:hypothetical protein
MMTEQERAALLAEARRTVKTTNFAADLCFRLARDAERDAVAREQMKLREMSRRFISKYGRPPREPLPTGHTAQIIMFPITRRQRTCRS